MFNEQNTVARDKSPAQYMEALRAEGAVGFSRLPRPEAGFQSPPNRTEPEN